MDTAVVQSQSLDSKYLTSVCYWYEDKTYAWDPGTSDLHHSHMSCLRKSVFAIGILGARGQVSSSVFPILLSAQEPDESKPAPVTRRAVSYNAWKNMDIFKGL